MRLLPVLRVWGVFIFFVTVFPNCIFAQSPGDTVGLSSTNPNVAYYGENQIETDPGGGLHFTWMSSPYGPERHIYYNYLTANGYWLFPGIGEMIDFRSGIGYPEISIFSDGRAIIAAHTASTGIESVFVARDAYQGLGQFYYSHLRFYQNPNAFIWPRVCVDYSNRIHLTATQTGNAGQSRNIGYRMSSDDGMTWTALQIAGQTYSIDAMVVASAISNKVAIVFKKPINTDYYSQDICYVQSEDGVTWDFENGVVAVTDYQNDPDSTRPVGQIDAMYNANDNLRIIWTARRISNGNFGSATFLYHFENGDGIIREIAHRDPQNQPDCRIDRVNSIDQPTIAIQPSTNKDIVAYVGYDPTDCSADSIPNGDIFLQWSDNFGAEWSSPVNITNSQTPGCTSGNCASDVNPSLAKKAVESAHLFYACDTRRASSYLYFPIPVGSMETGDDGKQPTAFSLSQNYPNPFNAVTTIKLQMASRGRINLSIYDIAGAKVTTLIEGICEAGEIDIKWEAGNMPSGTYFCRARMDGKSASQKMILLK